MTDMQINRITKYDPLQAKAIRDIKASDIFNIVGTVSGTVAATAVATGTTGANEHLYPYIWYVGVDTDTVAIFALVAGTDTVAYQICGGTAGHLKNMIISIPEAPIHRLGVSSTYTIIVIGPLAGVNHYSTLVCKREPILRRVETQLT